jgi:hypothetical protein
MTNTVTDLWVLPAIIQIHPDTLTLWWAILTIDKDTDIVSESEQVLLYLIEVVIYTIFIV